MKPGSHRDGTCSALGPLPFTQVRDKHCAGSISVSHSRIAIEHLQKPSMSLADADGETGRSNIHHRPAVCKGNLDSVELIFEGEFTRDMSEPGMLK